MSIPNLLISFIFGLILGFILGQLNKTLKEVKLILNTKYKELKNKVLRTKLSIRDNKDIEY